MSVWDFSATTDLISGLPTIAVATFDAGAKLDWHMHPGDRILLIMQGTGLLSGERKANTNSSQGGRNKVSSRRRALALCNTDKWLHLPGNYPDSKGKTVRLEPVSDKDYQQLEIEIPFGRFV